MSVARVIFVVSLLSMDHATVSCSSHAVSNCLCCKFVYETVRWVTIEFVHVKKIPTVSCAYERSCVNEAFVGIVIVCCEGVYACVSACVCLHVCVCACVCTFKKSALCALCVLCVMSILCVYCVAVFV